MPGLRTKFRERFPRAGDAVASELQISPLRCALVERTTEEELDLEENGAN